MRAKVDSLGFPEAQLQYFGSGECDTPVNSCVLIRVRPRAEAGGDQEVAKSLQSALGTGYAFRRVEVVGPKVSGELFRDGIVASILAVIMISIYVTVRFEWQYGVGALIATGHDVFVTAGMYSLLHLDFTLTSVAALLTLAGYSVNDTVVVFDRIRELLRKYKKMPIAELLDLSINSTLSRTVMTSVTTSLALLALVLFGGSVIKSFSWAMIFGVVIGTYSSIFIAAPVLIYLGARVSGDSQEATSEGSEASQSTAR